jgi:hypothetical protein
MEINSVRMKLGIVLCEESLICGVYSQENQDAFYSIYPLQRLIRKNRDGSLHIASLSEYLSEIQLPQNFPVSDKSILTSNDYFKNQIDQCLKDIRKNIPVEIDDATICVAHSYSEKLRFFLRSIFLELIHQVSFLNEDLAVLNGIVQPESYTHTLVYNLRHNAIELSLLSHGEKKMKHISAEVIDSSGINKFDLRMIAAAKGYKHVSQVSHKDISWLISYGDEYRKELYKNVSTRKEERICEYLDQLLLPSWEMARRLISQVDSQPRILFLSAIEESDYYLNGLQKALGVPVVKVPRISILNGIVSSSSSINIRAKQEDRTDLLFPQWKPLVNRKQDRPLEIPKNRDNFPVNLKSPSLTSVAGQPATDVVTSLRQHFITINSLIRKLSASELNQVTDEFLERAILVSAEFYIGQNKIEEAYQLYKKFIAFDEKSNRLKEIAASLCLNQAKSLARDGGDPKLIKMWWERGRRIDVKNKEIRSGFQMVGESLRKLKESFRRRK